MQVLAIIAMCVACGFATPSGYGTHSHSAPVLLRSESYGGHAILKSHIPIVKYLKTDDNYGTYSMDVQTGDGSSHIEHGSLKSVSGPDSVGPVNVKEGSYSWTSPEGEHFTVNYVADENGYRASGAHLPTPPPIPVEILKSLALPRVVDAYSAPALRLHSPTLIRSNAY